MAPLSLGDGHNLVWRHRSNGRHDTRINDIQHNDKQHNHEFNATLSIMKEHCYAEWHLCWVSRISLLTLSVVMLNVVMRMSLCWMSLCWMSLCWMSLCWMSLWGCRYAECSYAECRYADCRGAFKWSPPFWLKVSLFTYHKRMPAGVITVTRTID